MDYEVEYDDYVRGGVGGSPEGALWAAVLHLAMRDLESTRASVALSARRWVNSDEQRVGSFVWVCDMLGIEPATVRSHAPAMRTTNAQVEAYNDLSLLPMTFTTAEAVAALKHRTPEQVTNMIRTAKRVKYLTGENGVWLRLQVDDSQDDEFETPEEICK